MHQLPRSLSRLFTRVHIRTRPTQFPANSIFAFRQISNKMASNDESKSADAEAYAKCPEFQRLKHWSEFGQKGSPSSTRATADNRQRKPFSKPVTAAWHLSVPPTEVSKLLNGFQPQEMEDKWFVYADGPDAQGNATIYMHRSWTGYKVVEAKFVVDLDEQGNVKENDVGARITEITWETDEEKVRGQDEDEAKDRFKGVCNWCLGVNLE